MVNKIEKVKLYPHEGIVCFIGNTVGDPFTGFDTPLLQL